MSETAISGDVFFDKILTCECFGESKKYKMPKMKQEMICIRYSLTPINRECQKPPPMTSIIKAGPVLFEIIARLSACSFVISPLFFSPAAVITPVGNPHIAPSRTAVREQEGIPSTGRFLSVSENKNGALCVSMEEMTINGKSDGITDFAHMSSIETVLFWSGAERIQRTNAQMSRIKYRSRMRYFLCSLFIAAP